MMKGLHLVAAACLALAALDARAHAHLKDSSPKEGAVVTAMPASISLTFSQSARITVVSIQKDAQAKQPLSVPTASGQQIDVKVPALQPGAYTLRWRAASTDDGHIMSGELHFKLAPRPQ